MVNMMKCQCMENEARRRVQVLSSHNVEELRAFLKEKANEAVPQPASYTIGRVVRAAFPELSLLRKRGYSLNMLVRLFEENGVKITATALSGYMKKLNNMAEEATANEAPKGRTQPSTSRLQLGEHIAMKSDVTV